MALTKNHEYYDAEGDWIKIEELADLEADDANYGAYSFVHSAQGGAYVTAAAAPSLALNILGHDAPTDDREGEWVPASALDRDAALDLAVTRLQAVIRFDLREKRLATAEQRRKSAAASLSSKLHSVVGLPITSPLKQLTGDDIGKLREALGRYDAELAN